MGNLVRVVQFDAPFRAALEVEAAKRGWKMDHGPTMTHIRPPNVVLTLYKSGKMVIQGGGAELFFQEFCKGCLEPILPVTVSPDDPFSRLPPLYFASDESGKGDFFGPLVIAGVVFRESERPHLERIGVRDSKALSDKKILEIGPLIRERLQFDRVTILPEKYNELFTKMGNQNSILGWGHSRVMVNLRTTEPKGSVGLIDQFTPLDKFKNFLLREARDIDIQMAVHGERNLGVAAASILAREAFVLWGKKSELALGIELPKGAGDGVIEAGKQILKTHGEPFFNKIAKLHFRTWRVVRGEK